MDKLYSYTIPNDLGDIQPGCRVEVEFGSKRRYAGVIRSIGEEVDESLRLKPILSLIDSEPLIDEDSLKLWEWMAEYYMCTLGEVMIAALPSVLKMSSESIISPTAKVADADGMELSEDEFLLFEALQSNLELKIEDVQNILQRKKVLAVVESLSAKRYLTVNEKLQDQYVPKKFEWLSEGDRLEGKADFDEVFDSLKRAPSQAEALLAFFQFKRPDAPLSVKAFLKKAHVNRSVLNALVKKEYLSIFETVGHRLDESLHQSEDDTIPDAQQMKALGEIRESFDQRKNVLLHGVTGSGKTRVYIELIKEQVIKGKQVLYLLPEIALTTQIESRLKSIFDSDIVSYHSRLNEQKRADVFRLVRKGFPIVLAARSGVFLPFNNLGLIIVDESHDNSYKQFQPSPRYQGRDTAQVLARLHECPVICGTATPSSESIYNCRIGLMTKVDMPERHGPAVIPQLEIVHLSKDRALEHETEIFSQSLLEEIEQALSTDRQVILFQNRRGYAPLLLCPSCDWRAECVNCDVSLTIHKYKNQLQCHHCNYRKVLPPHCPNCKSKLLRMDGFGTEKVQAELKEFFPSANIERLDFDNTRKKKSFQSIIDRFSTGESQILVGTQMVTKGLDFENVALVGILQADRSLFYPNFRASERGLQLLLQVSGRAGRRKEPGKVLVQTQRPDNPVFGYLKDNRYLEYLESEFEQRKALHYPPYSRMIKIVVRHKDALTSHKAAQALSDKMRPIFGSYISGVAPHYIPRLNNQYHFVLTFKMPKHLLSPAICKDHLKAFVMELRQKKEFRSVRFVVDVDPA